MCKFQEKQRDLWKDKGKDGQTLIYRALLAIVRGPINLYLPGTKSLYSSIILYYDFKCLIKQVKM